MKHKKEWEQILDKYIDVDSNKIMRIYTSCNCDLVSNFVGEFVFDTLIDEEDYKSITHQLVAEYFDL